jgi:hypothetical protein
VTATRAEIVEPLDDITTSAGTRRLIAAVRVPSQNGRRAA